MARAKANRKKPSTRQQRRLPKFPGRQIAVALGVLAIGSVLFYSTQYLLNRPVQALNVESTFQRVTAIQVEAVVAREIERGFLAADLSRLRQKVEGLEWVESATIERRWPDTFALSIEEHSAAARWGETGLLNRHGQLFAHTPAHLYPELPLLAGPAGTERTVAQRYLTLRGRLAQANLGLATLTLDDRWAWRFVLEGGTSIELGRTQIDERLDRFFNVVYPALATRLGNVAQVDLRYSNGFAVGWREPDAHANADLVQAGHSG